MRHAKVSKHTCITSMSKTHLGSSSRTGTTSGSTEQHSRSEPAPCTANRWRSADVQKCVTSLRTHKSSRALAADPVSSSAAASARLLPALPVPLALPRWTRNTRRLACDSRRADGGDEWHRLHTLMLCLSREDCASQQPEEGCDASRCVPSRSQRWCARQSAAATRQHGPPTAAACPAAAGR